MSSDNAAGGLSITRVPIAQLVPDPKNARKHGKRNLDAIRLSLQRFGQRVPLVVRRDNTIIGGNATASQMRALGWTECDVVVYDGTDDEAKALALALNRSGELATWDDDVLAETLAGLDRELAEAAGWLGSELERVIGHGGAEEGGEVPSAPPIPTTRRGDLWTLGDHRILCGDSTSAECVGKLMGDDVSQLLATDPPYLVDYNGGNHPQSYQNKPDVKDKEWDDYVDPSTGVEFFAGWLAAWLPKCIEAVPIYQWHASRRQSLVEQAWEKHDILVHQTIIWAKSRPVLTRSHFMWQHEPCFYGWRRGHMPKRPPANERSVWEIDQQGEQDGIHPTQKPVAIFERPMLYHTERGDIVAEPFSGSGTQLMAAEKTGRRCRAMEISEQFVDVAVTRWQNATGRSAILDGDGRTFDQVKDQRASENAGAAAAGR